MDIVSDEENLEAWVAYSKAKRAKKNMSDGGSRDSTQKYGKGKVENAAKYRTGEINRCFVRNSEYHYAPQCPRKGGKGGVRSPSNNGKQKPPLKPYSSIALESPAGGDHIHENNSPAPAPIHEDPFSTTIHLGGVFVASKASSAVVLDAGATANLVRRAWLANRNQFLRRLGMEQAHLYPSAARFQFGDGRIGEVRHAANITVGVAGCKGARFRH